MTSQLLRDLVANSEELVERYRDTLHEAKQFGDFENAYNTVLGIRAVNSTIRKARKIILDLEAPKQPTKHFDCITGYFV